MTVNDLLILVRQRLGDMQKITFSDYELLYCLNVVLNQYCMLLAEDNNPEILKEFTAEEDGFELPDDFIQWQGQFPVAYSQTDEGKTWCVVSGPEWEDGEFIMKYYASKPDFTSMDDEIPFRNQDMCYKLMRMCVELIKPSSSTTSSGGGSSDS